jgi:predicted dehydrogenase
VAQRGHPRRVGGDGNLREGADAPAYRQGAAGGHRRRRAFSTATSKTVRWACFESTRYARGHKALYTFEINGEHASIRWDLHDLNRLEYFDHRDESVVRGWRSIHVTDGDQPYMNKWWVPGLGIGYEHSFIHQVADFLKGLETGQSAAPTFRDALQTQKVCQAVPRLAAARSWKDTGVEGKVG